MKQPVFLVLLILILATSCNKDEFKYGVEKDFKAEVEYFTSDESFGFEIYGINDSRCPISMDCFWEGEAIIDIKSLKPSFDSISLSTHDNLIDTILNYKFSLIEVNPYPEDDSGIEMKDYRVRMIVEEL